MKRERKIRKTRVESASLEETALYLMFLSEALFEVLIEKGLVTHDEMTARMKKLQRGTELRSVASD